MCVFSSEVILLFGRVRWALLSVKPRSYLYFDAVDDVTTGRSKRLRLSLLSQLDASTSRTFFFTL